MRKKEYESELNEAASSASGTEAPLRAVVKNLRNSQHRAQISPEFNS